MLTWLDIILLVIAVYCIALGISRGLLKEGLGLLVWIIALLVAQFYTDLVAQWLTSWISNYQLRIVTAFILIAFVIVVIGGFIIRFLDALLHWAGMGSFNRLLGGLFGAAKAALILAIIGLLIPLTPLISTKAWQNAQLKPLVIHLEHLVVQQYHRFV